MGVFWKAASGVMICLVLGMALRKQEKDLSLVLTIAVCCMVCMPALTYLEPVLEFLRELETVGHLQRNMLEILLKIVGISIVGEITGTVCTDGGNASLGKAIQLLANVLILYLSLPIMRTLLDMIRKIMGAL